MIGRSPGPETFVAGQCDGPFALHVFSRVMPGFTRPAFCRSSYQLDALLKRTLPCRAQEALCSN